RPGGEGPHHGGLSGISGRACRRRSRRRPHLLVSVRADRAGTFAFRADLHVPLRSRAATAAVDGFRRDARGGVARGLRPDRRAARPGAHGAGWATRPAYGRRGDATSVAERGPTRRTSAVVAALRREGPRNSDFRRGHARRARSAARASTRVGGLPRVHRSGTGAMSAATRRVP